MLRPNSQLWARPWPTLTRQYQVISIRSPIVIMTIHFATSMSHLWLFKVGEVALLNLTTYHARLLYYNATSVTYMQFAWLFSVTRAPCIPENCPPVVKPMVKEGEVVQTVLDEQGSNLFILLLLFLKEHAHRHLHNTRTHTFYKNGIYFIRH